jgi:hypothetical protein
MGCAWTDRPHIQLAAMRQGKADIMRAAQPLEPVACKELLTLSDRLEGRLPRLAQPRPSSFALANIQNQRTSIVVSEIVV